jgi:hypothetical protein
MPTRKEATLLGLKKYDSSKPCPKGHIGQRYVSSSNCCICSIELQKKKFVSDPEYFRRNARVAMKKDPVKNANRAKAWRNQNKKRFCDAVQRWKKNNPEKQRHLAMKSHAARRAAKLNRTPLWLSKSDLESIGLRYKEAQAMTNLTGIKHTVDHIIPLQGKLVSGLHVPSNLCVIPDRVNYAKGNKFVEAWL